ncbi:hypothetical protein QEK82_001387 [Stenotrophomonas maltophilia]|uniref:hypothetical protein n=1 Tax=Stenotrophomonas maltophilia group sp. Smal13 TaxID=3377166 RepID=UPI0013113AB4|nr:hypothetical protein [Stenotrophomonas maltophilia]EKU9958287.1 hypothetical protein [Stenotrophomonas maltophilia]EKU9984593.1 hypothetical protein [Stenotrophomonas maltophilia]
MSNVTPIRAPSEGDFPELSVFRAPGIYLHLMVIPDRRLSASLVLTDLRSDRGLEVGLMIADAPFDEVGIRNDIAPASLDVGEAMFVLPDFMVNEVEQFLREVTP